MEPIRARLIRHRPQLQAQHVQHVQHRRHRDRVGPLQADLALRAEASR